jgi:ribosomal protein S18 acetylase RimI-like enzyme
MIRLTPMTEADFSAYLEKMIPEYAREKVQAGNWTEAEALERSRKEYEGFLPAGLRTPGHFLFMILSETDEKVGFLWYALDAKRADKAFLYDFEIYEPFRRRGYASAALAALEQDARPRGVKLLELHVFGHNAAARALYQKVGYVETNVNMAKQI